MGIYDLQMNSRPSILATLSCVMIAAGVLSVPTGAAQSSAHKIWTAFLAKPSEATFVPLSRTIQACVASKCKDDSIAGMQDNFADFYRLLRLVEQGNHLGMELAFQIRPVFENVIAPSEDLDNSLGLSATREPEWFLQLARKYNVSSSDFAFLVAQTSRESIDNLLARRRELERRIQSFSQVRNPSLLPIRQQAISAIEVQINQIGRDEQAR